MAVKERGFYDDPDHIGMVRWWDGEKWTDLTKPDQIGVGALTPELADLSSPKGVNVMTDQKPSRTAWGTWLKPGPARLALVVGLAVVVVLVMTVL